MSDTPDTAAERIEWRFRKVIKYAIGMCNEEDDEQSRCHQLIEMHLERAVDHVETLESVIVALRAERDAAIREIGEQARLLGISGSREAALMAEVERLQALQAACIAWREAREELKNPGVPIKAELAAMDARERVMDALAATGAK